ncbi:RNA-dependent RNA polymerase 1 [Vicia villosa]|uniref:RNA-dependent RNA polymerase 1 n=1 Tax=Vicia villosa TaxID=3911 RepID=UPI00273BE674|nr:RNA-dependent RNA polymerase 1 [Vicia villosa]XP_058724419.1 RNA-dependent RNA polymerase 1 [Vicia villosa]XP_058724420.1 RNA-dependent RNA polymerase 1 [Vicia villosa]XP_058724423.1 RNA-dependent RNA polymerase 1 [Vicia villosa]
MGKSKTVELYGFPTHVNVSDVKRFVEKLTGEGSVFAMKVRVGKGRSPRAFAIIQFTAAKHATYMMALLSGNPSALWYGSSYLKVREMERDIDSKPKEVEDSLDDVKLYFGCQISKERFSVLWIKEDVSVVFGSGTRKWRFSMRHGDKKFRLDLSYENIWKIELRQPRGEIVKYLLIQLIGAPRVFELYIPTSTSATSVYDDPLMNYCRDDQWIRAIDFTPCSCIGQSSVLCLELPSDRDLPNFRENFAHYEESDGQYRLESGSPFSSNPDIVPMVAPPRGIQIPFDILFKVNSLVQHGCLSGSELDNDFYRLVDPLKINVVYIEHALERMFFSKDFCYEPARWLKDQYRLSAKNPPRSPSISLDNGLVYVRRVQITPCKVYFSGPEINVSNRVLRHFHEHIDNFLRVSFVDEEMDKLYSADLSTRISEIGKTEIYCRILSILRNGLDIGGRKFEFLAFSSSQLRENSLWMFARTTTGVTANSIREWMGDFSRIKNVAKYAARLGQSFGSSTETLSVSRYEIETIPDVKVKNTEYVFSDGIGKISLELARRVAKKCGYDSMPSAFQIRYGGYKGVVAVDPTSYWKLSLRESMHKYDSENEKLDVLACSKVQPCYLNRQLITLLSTLDVKDSVFEKRQKEAVDQLNTILTDSTKAHEVLDLMSSGEVTNILKEMLICGYKPNVEPFLSMMLQTFRASKLLELRQKTRIFIPKGRAMMGVLDETKTLEYGEVFVQYSYDRFSNHSHVVKGKVVVAKNPCLHPGDVRVLKAVDVPDLRHMVDCVVFPQKGHRPHPNECSGSDLDGDIYFVCWDSELIPPKTIDPMEYDTAQPKVLDHDVEIEEVEEYFANYLVNDSLGIIANAHTVHADREPEKAMSDPCIRLAKLFSVAVDFPKTGIPAEIPRELFAKEYPDFMEKHDKTTYRSENVIGKLFREIQGISTKDGSITSFTFELAKKSYDPDMEFDGFMDYVDDAFYYKSNYDYKLGNLMDYYGIKTESEILSGNIMKMSKSFTKRRDADAITMAVRSLRKEARSWFNDGSDSGGDDAYAKASAWYHVTYHHSYYGLYNEGMKRDHFLSFPWCVYHLLVQIKKGNASMRMHSSMEQSFSRRLRLD